MARLRNVNPTEPMEKVVGYVASIVSVSVANTSPSKAYIVVIELVVRMRTGDWNSICSGLKTLSYTVDASTWA
jgi:hypothetical protein